MFFHTKDVKYLGGALNDFLAPTPHDIYFTLVFHVPYTHMTLDYARRVDVRCTCTEDQTKGPM